MHLVVNHVAQFQHVDYADCRRLVETLTGSTVIQVGATATRYTSFSSVFIDLFEACTIEDRGSKLQSQFTTCPTQYGFVDLSQVHTRRHTQRVQYDIDDRTIFEERHIFVTNDFGNDTLVTVTTCHLITYAEFTFLSDVNLSQLNNTGRQFITIGEVVFVALEHGISLFVFDDIVVDGLFNQEIQVSVTAPLVSSYVQEVDLVEQFLSEAGPFGNHLYTKVVVDSCSGFVLQQDA